ncbi:MAG: SOS response-associated peptidase [Firmicutes bacterium]|nr:SOS response-associated peptidase [Bacillota bacterium]
MKSSKTLPPGNPPRPAGGHGESRYLEIMRKGKPVHDPDDAFRAKHPAMPLSRRAKIFSPFDALKGFREAIAAKEEAQYAEGCENTDAEECENTEESERSIMCTRFYIDISDKELKEIIDAVEGNPLADRFVRAGDPLTTSGEVRPTNVVPCIATARTGRKSVFPMKWGFNLPSPKSGSPVSLLLNARSETASEKRTFRESWAQRRCIIPASYYFEWEHFTSPDGKKKTGRKYAIQPEGSAITWLGGLYRIEEGFPHFVVLTRPPAKEIEFIHDRMPVILPQAKIDEWIDPSADPGEIIKYALDHMVYDAAAG